MLLLIQILFELFEGVLRRLYHVFGPAMIVKALIMWGGVLSLPTICLLEALMLLLLLMLHLSATLEWLVVAQT